MSTLPLLFTLACIGISVTSYLIRERLSNRVPVCFIGADCGKVLESQYNKTLGIHNDLLGMLYYLSVAVLLGLLLLEIGPYSLFRTFIFIQSTLAAAMSVYFTFVQARIIKAWCSWCLTSAILSWLMLIVSIIELV